MPPLASCRKSTGLTRVTTPRTVTGEGSVAEKADEDWRWTER